MSEKPLVSDPTDKILAQLAEVRKDGGTNMLDMRGVQRIANELELHALVLWLEPVIRLRDMTSYMQALQNMPETDDDDDDDDMEDDDDE